MIKGMTGYGKGESAYAGGRIIVELRCVMPKTTDANNANTTAAEKCDKLTVTVFSPAQYDAHPLRR